MSKGDGKNPKFRVLCRKCNSYLHTVVDWEKHEHWKRIVCDKCGNTADSFEEEQ